MWAMFSVKDFTFVDFIDILIVSYVIYKLITLIRGTKAIQLLKGITVIISVWFLSNLFRLETLEWLMDQAITWGFLAIIIIFQPELRRALEQLGRGRFFSRTGSLEEEDIERSIESMVKAVQYMAKRRIGALISVGRETGLNDYVETGISLNAKLTTQLLVNIFIPNTPLHDGAVIVKENQIVAAACYLPLSESPFISKELGTRHRAALGISEVTDSLTIVVSEETGHISLTKNGELHRNIDEEKLKSLLTQELLLDSKSHSSSRWNWRGRNHG
jgi:diadenylate cyclase